MEDASAVDLDWFWRGWFYTTDYTDIGVKEVKKFYVSNEPTAAIKKRMEAQGRSVDDLPPLVYFVEEGSEDFKESMKNQDALNDTKTLKEYVMDNFTPEERKTAVAAAKSMGLNVAGVDLLRSSRGPLVMEVNSSPGLEGIEIATGKDIAGMVIDFIEKNASIKGTATRGKG